MSSPNNNRDPNTGEPISSRRHQFEDTNNNPQPGQQQQQQQQHQQHAFDTLATPMVNFAGANINNNNTNNNFSGTPSMDGGRWDATPKQSGGLNSSFASVGSGGGFAGGQTPMANFGGNSGNPGASTMMANNNEAGGGNFGATPMVTPGGGGAERLSNGSNRAASSSSSQQQQRGGVSPTSGRRLNNNNQFHESRFGAVDTSLLLGIQQQLALQDGGNNSGTNNNNNVLGNVNNIKTNIAEDFQKLSRAEQMMVRKILDSKRYISDEQLDEIIPPGYSVVEPPADYQQHSHPNNNTNNNDSLLNNAAASGNNNNNQNQLNTNDQTNLVDAALQENQQQQQPTKNKLLDLPVDGIISDDLPPLNFEDTAVFELLIEYRKMPDSAIPPAHVKKVQVLRALLKFKNGRPTQRRSGVKDLTTKARYYGVETLLTPIVSLWQSEGVLQDELDRHRVVKLLSTLLLQFRGIMPAPQIREVLLLVQPLLHHRDVYTRQEGREVMASLIKASGFEEMVKAIRRDMEDDKDETRRAAAETLLVIAETLGVDAENSSVIKLIDILCRARKNWYLRHTGAKTIMEIAQSPRIGVTTSRRYLDQLVAGCVECLRVENSRVRSQAALALGALAEAIRPFGYAAFRPALPLLREQVATARGTSLISFLKGIGSIMMLMGPRDAREQAKVLTDQLQRCFADPKDEFKNVALRVVDQILAHDGIAPEFVKDELLVNFLNNWSMQSLADKKNSRQLLETTGNFAKKVGGTLILAHLRERLEQDVPALPDPSHKYVETVCHGLRIIVERSPASTIIAASDDEVRATFDALLDVLNRDREGKCRFLEDTIAVVCRAIGNRFAPLCPRLIRSISSRLGDRHLRIRRQAACILARTIHSIGEYARLSIDTLRDAWTVIDQKIIHEHNPPLVSGTGVDASLSGIADKIDIAHTISSGLQACTALLEVWCSYGRFVNNRQVQDDARDHVKRILDAVAKALKSPLFKNNCEFLKEQCVKTVLSIIELNRQNVEVATPEVLFNIAVESLLLLLETGNRKTRALTTRAFGAVADLIGPLHIIKKLIERGLRRDDQNYRKCAAVALAVVAKACGPFVVIPFLVFEYEQSQRTELAVKIQHSVLKCLRFIFEFIAGEPQVVSCIHAVLPMLERALTERELQHRRMGCEAVREMILACGGGIDNEGSMRNVWLHLFNFVMPTMLEPISNYNSKDVAAAIKKEQRKAVSAVVEVLEAARLVLPAAYILQLLEQGMFHPARFVREAYWNTYNTIAVGCGEQLVPFYPSIGNAPAPVLVHQGANADPAEKNQQRHEQYRRGLLEVIV